VMPKWTIVVCLIFSVLIGCRSSGTWKSAPTFLYKERYILVSPDGSIRGEVSYSDGEYAAFIHGRYCGSGEYETKEPAMHCVERWPF
jgi:hypothetical protein